MASTDSAAFSHHSARIGSEAHSPILQERRRWTVRKNRHHNQMQLVLELERQNPTTLVEETHRVDNCDCARLEIADHPILFLMFDPERIKSVIQPNCGLKNFGRVGIGRHGSELFQGPCAIVSNRHLSHRRVVAKRIGQKFVSRAGEVILDRSFYDYTSMTADADSSFIAHAALKKLGSLPADSKTRPKKFVTSGGTALDDTFDSLWIEHRNKIG